MDKKGKLGDQIYLTYVVFIFLIIISAVVIGSYLHTNKEYDIRMQDAEILLGKITECLSNTPSLTEIQILNLFDTCKINKVVMEKGLVLGISSSEKEIFKYGDIISCGLQDKNINYPRCTNSILQINLDGKETELFLTVGSNLKSEKKNEQ